MAKRDLTFTRNIGIAAHIDAKKIKNLTFLKILIANFKNEKNIISNHFNYRYYDNSFI